MPLRSFIAIIVISASDPCHAVFSPSLSLYCRHFIVIMPPLSRLTSFFVHHPIVIMLSPVSCDYASAFLPSSPFCRGHADAIMHLLSCRLGRAIVVISFHSCHLYTIIIIYWHLIVIMLSLLCNFVIPLISFSLSIHSHCSSIMTAWLWATLARSAIAKCSDILVCGI